MTTRPTDEIVAMLDQVWTAVRDLLAELDDADWDRPSELPGWTVRDIASHIIGTEAMLAGEPAPEVDVEHLPHVTSTFAAMMEAPVEARRDRTPTELLTEFDDVRSRRLTMLRGLDEQGWEQLGWSPVGEAPYRTFMEVRVFDCWMHEQDVRRAVGIPGNLDTAAAGLSVERVRSAMGYVVGKKAGAAEGAVVEFALPAQGGGPLTIAVNGGRASELKQGTEADVVLTFDGIEPFVALGGGRWDRERALSSGAVAVEGDIELGHKVLESMAITP